MEKEPGTASFRDCLKLIKEDFDLQYGDGLFGLLARYVLDAGVFGTVNYRIAHYLCSRGKTKAAHLITRFTARFAVVWICPEARIGRGFATSHADGIKIGPNTVIGKHCIIHHNVLLTKNLGRTRVDENGQEYDEPRIGDYTHLLPGCYILGPVNIGDHVMIAPQTVVTQDVPSYSLVAGERSAVIRPIDPTDPKHLDRFASVLPQAWDEEWQRKFGWTGDDSPQSGDS